MVWLFVIYLLLGNKVSFARDKNDIKSLAPE